MNGCGTTASVGGSFDAIVSVEMIEAVGANHWTEYFGVLHDRLATGGRIGLQAITMPHDRMMVTRTTTPGFTSTSSRAG